MQELIERLEKATGPDRDLDRLIGLAVGYLHLDSKGSLYKIDPEDGTWVYGGLSDDILILRYTASIDTALKAGEPGWEYNISTLYGVADVEIPLNDTRVDPVRVRREHGNVAVALCEAIVKARAALKSRSAGQREGEG